MTPETETAPPAVGSNVRDNNDATTAQDINIPSKSNAINRGQGCSRGGFGGIGSHQGCGGRGIHFNHPLYTLSIQNFEGEVENFGKVLGNTAEQIEAKDGYKKFSNKLKQYVLQEFQNPA